MTKQKFSEYLLSRFCSLDMETRQHLINNLVLAAAELEKHHVHEGDEFTDWAEVIKELLFPEILGDLVFAD